MFKLIKVFLSSIFVLSCSTPEPPQSSGYAVYLSLEGEEVLQASKGKSEVVLDPQYVTAEEVAAIKKRGTKVYAYLNIGSIETFRDYYNDFESLILKPYVDWDEEYWVDVSNQEWQDFINNTLAPDIIEKGMDGFWIDNVDVYGQVPTPEIYAGVESMLTTLMSFDKAVIINGGNEFVQKYLDENSQVDDIMTGVNQETIFSAIDFENATFHTQSDEEHSYFLEYVNELDAQGKDIYLLEYTTDDALIEQIATFANDRNWRYYVSDSIELDGD